MIIIEDKGFKMEQAGESGAFFNLSVLIKINAGTDKEREEMKVIAYGLPFEAGLRRVASHILSQEDKTYNVAEYIERYNEVINSVASLVLVKKPVEKVSEKETK